ncbi:MAG: transcription antitermination factor NusB [Propionicimonas sp.]
MTSAEGNRKLSTRTKARKRALDLLFEADLRGLPVAEVLAAHTEAADPPVRPFTAELVEGVAANAAEIDQLIAAQLPAGWSLERMPRVDRNLARLAAFELTGTSIDPAIALAECVVLASELSTDESPAFLNGVLGAVARAARPGSQPT